MRCKSTRVCYVARAGLHRQRVELSKQNSARYLHFDKSALPAGHSDAENSLISYFNTFFHRNQNRTIVLCTWKFIWVEESSSLSTESHTDVYDKGIAISGNVVESEL